VCVDVCAGVCLCVGVNVHGRVFMCGCAWVGVCECVCVCVCVCVRVCVYFCVFFF